MLRVVVNEDQDAIRLHRRDIDGYIRRDLARNSQEKPASIEAPTGC